MVGSEPDLALAGLSRFEARESFSICSMSYSLPNLKVGRVGGHRPLHPQTGKGFSELTEILETETIKARCSACFSLL